MPTMHDKAKTGTQAASGIASVNTLIGEIDPTTSPPALADL